jgi:uncharacterized protein YjbJ (UPF0337 family)
MEDLMKKAKDKAKEAEGKMTHEAGKAKESAEGSAKGAGEKLKKKLF